MHVLYHYTTVYGASAIQQTKTINCAVRHAHHGPGVYFTSLSPHTHTKMAIARNNYRAGQFRGVKIPGTTVYQVSPGVTIPGRTIEQVSSEGCHCQNK